jgi:hypothetical protein
MHIRGYFKYFSDCYLVFDVYCIDLDTKTTLENFFKENFVNNFKINSIVTFQVETSEILK